VENLIERQGELFDRVSSYRGHTATVEVNETVDGERVYREPGDGNPDRLYASGMVEPFSGGVELNADAITNASDMNNRTQIITDNHRIYIDSVDDNTTRAEVDLDRDGSIEETYETQALHPYVDLGEGSFDGYQFREYDQTDITSVRIENADNSHNSDISDTEVTVELVGKGTFNSAFTTEDAVFGVEYTVTVQSDRQETTMTRMATHGPTRGEV